MKKYIVLATVLAFTSFKLFAQDIEAADAAKYIGKSVKVCGKIFGGRFFESNEKTLLNMGAAFPDHPITIAIGGAVRKKLDFKPEEIYTKKTICVTGEIKEYKGKPELVVTDIDQITIAEVKIQ